MLAIHYVNHFTNTYKVICNNETRCVKLYVFSQNQSQCINLQVKIQLRRTGREFNHMHNLMGGDDMVDDICLGNAYYEIR